MLGTSRERRGWRVELRNEIRPCPGGRVVKSCYLVVLRLRRCKVTFTRKGFVRTGVQGLSPGCLVDRDWDARSHLPAANLGGRGEG